MVPNDSKTAESSSLPKESIPPDAINLTPRKPTDDAPFPPTRQRSAIGRLLVNLPVYCVFMGAMAKRRLGWGHPVDGWRRVTGVGLRLEASKFALAVFDLNLWSDDPSSADAPPLTIERAHEHFVLRFASFLRGEPLGRLEMVHERSLTSTTMRHQVDLTLAEFGPAGELLAIRPFLDSTLDTPKPREEVIRDRILPALVSSFNKKRLKWDRRPPAVTDYVAPELDGSAAAPGAARAYVKRILAATFVSFEPMRGSADDASRFAAPDFHLRRGPGFGPLNVVCRLSPDGRAADIWVQAHHAATDGLPVQEMLARLEHSWGLTTDGGLYPRAGVFSDSVPRSCSGPGTGRTVALLQEFLDFTPLLDLRKKLNDQVPIRTAGGVSVAALLIWTLSHQPPFAGKKFSLACESTPVPHRAGAVGMLSIRPGEYFGALNRAAAFAAFVHEFNRLLDLARDGTGPTCQALDRIAILPPAVQAYALRVNAADVDTTFGTVGLSVLRDSKVFITPFIDEGFGDGFIAIGDMALRAFDGGRVGAVSIKGNATQIAKYPLAMRTAIDKGFETV